MQVPWEQRKLGDVSNLSSSKRIHLSDYVDSGIPFYRGSEISNGGVSGEIELFISKSLYNEIREKYGVPVEGDLLVTAVGTLGNIWKVDSRNFYFKDGNLIRLSDLRIETDYLVSYFSDKPGKKKLLDSSAGSNQKALTMIKMKEIKIPIPSLEEQVKIGTFINYLNNTITLHERKLGLLKQIKRGFMQQMFPSEGENTPKMRFADFKGDWEQRKLGESTKYIKGFAFQSKDYQKSGVRIIRVSDLSKDKIENLDDSILVSKELAEINKRYRINNNEIIITTVGSKSEMKDSAVGRPIIVNSNGHYLLNQNLVKISALQGYDNYFIYNQLLRPKYTNYIAMIERGNANQANIAIKDLWVYQFGAPKETEQQKIGSFFKQLDKFIALHEEKINTLKSLKNLYLKNLFI